MKTDTTIFSDILSTLQTTQDVNDLLRELDFIASEIFKTKNKSLDKILPLISAKSAKNIADIFAKNKLNSGRKEEVSDLLEKLKESLKNFKIIKLTLAFEPSLNTIGKIHSFVLNNVGSGYILEIEVSENIMGGAIVIFNGKYGDFTLRKSLNDAFMNKKEEVVRLMQ